MISATARSSETMPEDGIIDAPASVEQGLTVFMMLGIVGGGRAAGEQRLNLRWMEIRARFVDREIAGHRGQIIRGTSEGLIAAFGRAVDAVRCAIELQRDIPAGNAATPDLAPVELCIGLGAGKGLTAEGEIPAESKDVTMAMLGLAGPGGIVVSAPVKDDLGTADGIGAETLGPVRVDNSARQVEAFRINYRAIGDQVPISRRAPARQMSLAVLPFHSNAADKRDDYFTEGIVEHIVSALGGVSDLFVVSRTSTGPAQGEEADLRLNRLLQLKDNFKKGQMVVVIFHDHGTRYLGKMFNPDWMRMMGYENLPGPTARDLVKNKKVTDLVGVEVTDTVERAVQRMSENDFSQIPITQERRIVGSLSESHAYSRIVDDPKIRKEPVKTIMQKAFRFVDIETPVELLAPMITPANPAVLVRDFKTEKTFIITRSDIIRVLM